jgi:type I restriction enzyme, S subunit
MKVRWELKKLQQVSAIVNGGTPDTNVPEYWDGDNLWITPKDMGKLRGRFVDDTFRKLTLSGLKNSSAKILPPNSLILSSRAPIGHLAINSKPISTNQGCKGLIPSDNLDTFYLYYFLLNSVEYLNSLGTGTTFKELSGSKLGQVEIPLPSLPEQQRIVSILDEAFAAIDKAKANAEKNLKNAKELFESYLQGVFENRGDGWEDYPLEAHIKLIDYRGRTPVKTESGTRLITAKNVKLGFLQLEPQEFIAENSYINWMSRGIPNFGDVIFTTEAPLGNVAQIDTTEKLAFAQRIIVMQPNPTKLNQYFLKYLLLSNPIRGKILSKATGATVLGIKSSLLKKIEISFPKSLDEQQAIVQTLDALSAETKRLESIYQQKLADLEELKKSILEKAFNGELNTADICA